MGLVLFIVGIVVAVVIFIAYAAWENQQRAERELAQLLGNLVEDPLNAAVHSQLLTAVEQPNFRSLPKESSARVYTTALSILEDHPDSRCAKTFVLSVGRWHFARCRQDGIGTATDEHVIQNDILVRSQAVKDELASMSPA